ncbi:MAG: hypothetical protein Q8P41_19540, partial [Pseudomonadota bacterium]|nr:hypothetical protein [Pseudomonadota bacterium]
MAWLSEAIQGRGHKSLRQFAKGAVGFPNAPTAENLLQHLSLADRGDPTAPGWFERRPEVVAAVARGLGWSEAAFLERLSGRHDDLDGLTVDLAELGSDRRWDLRHDPLFPGVPDEVRSPARWRRLWWHAWGGAGRSLVGRWLHVQHDVVFIRETTWARAQAALRPGRAHFVELSDPEGAEPLLRADGLESWPICVAAPFAPPDPPQPRMFAGVVPTGPWTIVRSPPVATWWKDLLAWAARFHEPDGGFTPARAEAAWTRLQAQRVFVHPGDVMAFCGLVAVFGESVGADHDRFCEEWFKRVSERGDRSEAARHWARKRGWVDLKRIATAALREPSSGPRPRDEWLRVAGVETVGHLEALGLLEVRDTPVGRPPRYGLRPAWIGTYATWVALKEAVAGPALGDLALASPDALEQRLLTLSWPEIEGALPPAPVPTPEGVATVETLFRVVGRKLLNGQPFVRGAATPAAAPTGLLARAWAAQAALAVPVDGLPRPRLGGDAASVGRWTLAALAISRTLADTATPDTPDPSGPDPAGPMGALAPWGRPWTPALTRLVTGLPEERGDADAHLAPTPADALLVALVERVPGAPILAVTAPAIVSRQAREGEVSPEAARALRVADACTAVLMLGVHPGAYAAGGRLAGAVWAQWQRRVVEGDEPGAWIADELGRHRFGASLVANAVPEAVWADPDALAPLRLLLRRRPGSADSTPFVLVPVWRALIRSWNDEPVGLNHVHPAALIEALAAGDVPVAALPAVWRAREPVVAADLARRLADPDPAAVHGAFRLLEHAPDETLEGALAAWEAAGKPPPPEAAAWAWALVARR